MKKTLNINLAGYVLYIDDDAYALLEGYLHQLQHHYGSSTEANEILADIEARLVELFREQWPDTHSVIDKATVQRAIDLIGYPEHFTAADQNNPAWESNNPGTAFGGQRKYYRDTDTRYIAGVAAGLGHYLGIDPIWVRLGFVLLQFFYGLGIVLYLILWVITKEARSGSQKLEMRGEPVNLSNLERNIRQGFDTVRQNVEEGFRRAQGEQWAHRAGNTLRVLVEQLWLVAVALLRATGVALGALMAFVGTLLLAGLISLLVAPNLPFLHVADVSMTLRQVLSFFLPATQTILLVPLVALLVGMPVVTLIYVGIKMVFRVRTNDKPVLIGLFGVWLLAFVVSMVVATQGAMHFSQRKQLVENAVLQPLPNDTLYLSMASMPFSAELFDGGPSWERISLVHEPLQMVGRPQIDIQPSPDSLFYLSLVKSAHGNTQQAALDHAQGIQYAWTQSGSKLVFNHYFEMPESKRWAVQHIDMVLKVPQGKVVYLDSSMLHLIYDIKNQQNMWDGHMGGKYWKMTSNTLSLLYPERYPEHGTDTNFDLPEMPEMPEVHATQEEIQQVIDEMQAVQEELLETELELNQHLDTATANARTKMVKARLKLIEEREKLLREWELQAP